MRPDGKLCQLSELLSRIEFNILCFSADGKMESEEVLTLHNKNITRMKAELAIGLAEIASKGYYFLAVENLDDIVVQYRLGTYKWST